MFYLRMLCNIHGAWFHVCLWDFCNVASNVFLACSHCEASITLQFSFCSTSIKSQCKQLFFFSFFLFLILSVCSFLHNLESGLKFTVYPVLLQWSVKMQLHSSWEAICCPNSILIIQLMIIQDTGQSQPFQKDIHLASLCLIPFTTLSHIHVFSN